LGSFSAGSAPELIEYRALADYILAKTELARAALMRAPVRRGLDADPRLRSDARRHCGT
jgi:hypothetical protein